LGRHGILNRGQALFSVVIIRIQLQRGLEFLLSLLVIKQSFGTAGFGIECARVVGEIKNPRFELARNWNLLEMPLPPAAA
jgi:hypothetical protein